MFHHHNSNSNSNSAMGRSRYEPVPQADQEIIELHTDPSYNYNTAIPNSPPPSFHSSQSTPAVSVVGDVDHDRVFNNVTPRPVPSAVAGATATASGNDAALIMNLHRRVERLEETIGRLLLEKPESDPSAPASRGSSDRSNCCVTFPSPSELSVLERAELLRAPSNCCVTFGGRRGGRSEEDRAQKKEWRRQRMVALAVAFGIFVVLGWITVLVWLRNRPRVVGCEACFAGAGGKGGAGGWSAAGQGADGSWSSSG